MDLWAESQTLERVWSLVCCTLIRSVASTRLKPRGLKSRLEDKKKQTKKKTTESDIEAEDGKKNFKVNRGRKEAESDGGE